MMMMMMMMTDKITAETKMLRWKSNTRHRELFVMIMILRN